jgi:hypothetical protein
VHSITTLSRTLIVIATAVAAFVVFGGAYSAGVMTQLQRELVNPASAPAQATQAISAIERALGHTGFLREYRAHLAQPGGRAAAALMARARQAEGALKTLVQLPLSTKISPQAMQEFEAIVRQFSLTAGNALSGAAVSPSMAEMEGIYAALRAESARLRQISVHLRIDAMSQIFSWGQSIVAAALVALVIGLVAVAAVLNLAVAAPMKSLYVSVMGAAQGQTREKIWGVERADELGALARAADMLRQTIAEAPNLSALAQGGKVKVSLEGPASILFEKLVGEVGEAARTLQTAADAVARSGGEGREQLAVAAQRLTVTAAEIGGMTQSARADVKDAVESVRSATSSVMASGQHLQGGFAHLSAQFGQGAEAMTASAGQVSERVTAALCELAAASEGLRMLAQDARANQSSIGQFASRAAGESAEAIGILQGASLGLKAALSSMDERIAKSVQSISRLGDGAAKETGGPELLAAIQDLRRTLDLALANAQTNNSAERPEISDMPPSMKAAKPARASTLPIAAADMLARLGNIAAEVRAAAGHDLAPLKDALSPVVAQLEAISSQSDGAQARAGAMGLAQGAAGIDAACANIGDVFAGLKQTAAVLCERLRILTAEAQNGSDRFSDLGLSDNAARLARDARALAGEIESMEASAPPAPAFPAPTLAATLEGAAQDIQRLSDAIADLEQRTEAMAAEAAQALDAGPDTGAPSELIQNSRAVNDRLTDEAIQAVFQSIERLNNIAQALARAGDAQSRRKVGD